MVLALVGCNGSGLPMPPAEVDAGRACLAPGAPECRSDAECCVGTCYRKAPAGQPLTLGECCLDVGMPCSRPDAPPCCGGLECVGGACR